MKNSAKSEHSNNILLFKRPVAHLSSKDIINYESLLSEMNMTELIEEVKHIGSKLNIKGDNTNALKGFSLLRRLQEEYQKINQEPSEEINTFINSFESLLTKNKIL